jgi:hypothetical protein
MAWSLVKEHGQSGTYCGEHGHKDQQGNSKAADFDFLVGGRHGWLLFVFVSLRLTP